MGRHLTEESRKRICELVEKGYTRKRIRAALNVTESQVELVLKQSGLKTVHEPPLAGGLSRAYHHIQAPKNFSQTQKFKESMRE